MTSDLDVLRRAHALFDNAVSRSSVHVPADTAVPGSRWDGSAGHAYRGAATIRHTQTLDARRVDAGLMRILAEAHHDHDDARRMTGAVVAAARTDASTPVDNPIAARELARRRALRLRAQLAHVRTARIRARRHRAAIRALRYRSHRGTGRDARATNAVRAALSRLGRPYVWGATGPDRFDCSGLVQWAYAQAGVPLRRTTYEQIQDGLPVARSAVRPGDLVFPHTGHVQMAIGNGLVVEAPQPGATVQISRMGNAVAIRRPV